MCQLRYAFLKDREKMFNFFKRKVQDPAAELKTFLGGYELPSFSTTVVKVLDLLRDPETSMSDIVPLVELDPGMTVKILRLVNSAGFGLTSKATSLQHAITLMGRSRLEAVVLSFGVSDVLPSTMLSMERRHFWSVAARRACLARIIADRLHPTTQAESFTVGLLMDMGIPVLDHVHREIYRDLLGKWKANRESSLVELEQDQFGYDHAGIGALMAEAWDLPDYITNGIAAHHLDGEDQRTDPAVQLVALLNYFEEDNGVDLLATRAEVRYGISPEEMDEMLSLAFSYAEQFTASFR